MIERFSVSRDDSIYEAFPDVALTPGGKLICVFAECTHHADRSYTRIVRTDSEDRGRRWSPKRPLSEPLRFADGDRRFWNCPRISTLSGSELAVVVDRVAKAEGDHSSAPRRENLLWFSDDEGESWRGPYETPVEGIVPDRLIELKRGPHAGRWLLTAHRRLSGVSPPVSQQRLWYSDDRGGSWSGPITIAESSELWLCEGSIVELPGGELVCVMRENSGLGLDAFKAISRDGGRTWSEPIALPIPACHRPVCGLLDSGAVLITHRYRQGGKGWLGWWTQNTFAAWTDVESMLAETRQAAHCRILPLDYDRSPEADTGYTGWVQFDDGEIVVVNYILDDAPKAWIRGYRLRERDIILPTPTAPPAEAQG